MLALFGGSKTVTEILPPWPYIGEDEIHAVEKALRDSRTDWRNISSVMGGGIVGEFEKNLGAFFDVPYVISTNSGGAALHIAVIASGVEAGDEVIVSPYSWGQTAACILQQNAIPVFADINPLTYTIDPEMIESCITPYTKAIVVVHIYGHPADMDPIMDIAKRHNLAVIEDCAQAAGAMYKGRRVGTIGNFGCFSIGAGKQMVGGEGGFLLTKDTESFERACIAGLHPARTHNELANSECKELIDSLIYTYRIHPLAAAICNVQLRKLDLWNANRRSNLERLSSKLDGVPGIRPVHVADGCQHVYHSYCMTYLPSELPGISRTLYAQALTAEGIPNVSTGYIQTPLHLLPRIQKKMYYFGKGYPWTAGSRTIEYAKGDCPIAEARSEEHDLAIFIGPNVVGEQIKLMDQISDAFFKVAEHTDDLRLHIQSEKEQ